MEPKIMTIFEVVRRQALRIALTTAFAVVVGVPAWSTIGQAAILGDCSGDGAIRSVDALLTLQYAANIIPHNSQNDAHYLTCADVAPLDANLIPVGDGQVRSADALTLLQRAAGLLTFTKQVPSAILKISTSGTLPAGTKIGAIDATVTYPTNKALTIFDTDITASAGVGTGTNCSPTNQTCYMLVPNTTTVFGQVVLALINPTGIASVGEIVTMNFHTAPPNPSPVAGDFTITGANVYDINGVLIPGVTVVISAAAIQ
ncbi:MAG TPA: hypothetical protein VIU41_07000 [Geobacteraceae bacterium]